MLVGWLVVLGFNATLTAKVISWQLVTYMCFLANTTLLSRATDYFSHMLLQNREVKIRRKESLPQTGSKSQPPGHESDTLTTQPRRWGSIILESTKLTFYQKTKF